VFVGNREQGESKTKLNWRALDQLGVHVSDLKG